MVNVHGHLINVSMRKKIKLSEYAKLHGVCYRTAFSWYQDGKIEGAVKSPSGSIFVEIPETAVATSGKVAVYSRVSNHSRREELKYQVERCVEWGNRNGYSIDRTFSEVASGMNDNRRKFWEMVKWSPSVLIVENKDRLTRFGFRYVEQMLALSGCKVVVINEVTDDESDLIRDLVSVITSFCCRLYGMRRMKNRLAKIRQVIEED